ncbi:MAG: TatD family hydrolase [Candidatus Thermoplasmatota archaeon]|nr:TatD family hydrolase [Candidatus Thermoplasmatota archaeon]
MATLANGLPILDAHIHLDPKGRPREAVRSFIERGGTHLVVVHKPYGHININGIKDQLEAFSTTLEMTELARDEGAIAWCFVGPYPGELPHLVELMGFQDAVNLMSDSLDEAARLVKQGKALGIGEIGRVHFPVEERIQNACDEILRKAFKKASILNCPIILHTESYHSNPGLMTHLSGMIERSGADKKMMIKHYSGKDLLNPDDRCGLSISLQCRRENLSEGLKQKADFLLETDYIDDLKRPNVVMPPDTVPKKMIWAYNKGIIDETEHHRLMIDLPKRILGVDMKA